MAIDFIKNWKHRIVVATLLQVLTLTALFLIFADTLELKHKNNYEFYQVIVLHGGENTIYATFPIGFEKYAYIEFPKTSNDQIQISNFQVENDSRGLSNRRETGYDSLKFSAFMSIDKEEQTNIRYKCKINLPIPCSSTVNAKAFQSGCLEWMIALLFEYLLLAILCICLIVLEILKNLNKTVVTIG